MNPKIILILLIIFGLSASIYSVSSRIKGKINRKPEVAGVDSLFWERWSPRAMSGQMVSDEELMPLFEAARWAPSSSNEQPWRFVYARNGTTEWNMFFDFLVPFNQEWCKNGSVLVMILSKKTSSRGGVNQCHSFDTGSAWENFALEGHMKGLVVHGMAGFDYEKARELLKVPADFDIEAMCVVGKPGDVKVLPKEMQAREKPSGRKALNEIVAEGAFSFET
ncbi:nitroreductase family protein [soil metagenome]